MSETRRLLLEFETEEVGIRASKDKRVRKALVAAFSDASDVVRERALLASIDIGDPTIVTDPIKAMTDEEDSVRIACAQALAFYHQPRTIPDLLKGLKDGNTWVRSHCAAGLSKLLRGPIWARLDETDIEDLVSGYPDTEDGSIRSKLNKINVDSEAIDRYMNWRSKDFDIEVDVTDFVKELEETPIVLAGAAEATAITPPEDAPRKPTGIEPEVEEILSELPEELRETLPEEDLRRLTPETARELVSSLTMAVPKKKPVTPTGKKKAVKVRKVKKVRRKKSGPSRQDLVEMIPDEVRESVSDDVLKTLTYEELEALIASTTETSAPEAEPPKKKLSKKKTIIETLPPEVRDSIGEEALNKKTVKQLEEIAAKASMSEDELRLQDFTEKYGEDKAEVLVSVPEEMLAGIPEEQILEMDLETLKALVQAL
ncbi:MAG: HEAT repeat domain-containing protein, partial [Candidatus Thorarchaeota archaeon]